MILTEVNTLNDKPFDKNKRSNILLLKKGYITQYLANVMPQAPVTVDQVEATPMFTNTNSFEGYSFL